MCFTISQSAKEKLLKKFGKKSFLVFYKVVTHDYSGICYFQDYTAGWNKCDSGKTEIDYGTHSDSSAGIYVCLTLQEARGWRNKDSKEKILRVKCYKKDLLNVNEYCSQATFSKIWIGKDQFK